MSPTAFLASGLAWLGRYGTQGFALSIFLGLALPQFSAMARPVLPITIFCFTTVVFMRLDEYVQRWREEHPLDAWLRDRPIHARETSPTGVSRPRT